jgi:hypothetical protein
MTEDAMTARSSNDDLLPQLRALTHLSTVDLLFADVYLRRAEELLPHPTDGRQQPECPGFRNGEWAQTTTDGVHHA